MKENKEVIQEDKELIKVLEKEARSNDDKIVVYPYQKRVLAAGKVIFRREWYVMKEGRKSTRKFMTKASAILFAKNMNKGAANKVIVAAK